MTVDKRLRFLPLIRRNLLLLMVFPKVSRLVSFCLNEESTAKP